ncbi:MAG: hypothetical protein Q8O74_02020, partial [bacterium]|nr:hypothetical protein [bacterium]
QIPSAIQMGTKQGMMPLNNSLADLVRKRLITLDEALIHTDNQEDLKNNLARAAAPVAPVK